MSEDRPPPGLVALPGRPDALARLRRFEAAHPEVTVLRPGDTSSPWRAIVPAGTIPGTTGPTLSSYGLAGLMDQLEPLFPSLEEDPET